jgi:hypothetical protein
MKKLPGTSNPFNKIIAIHFLDGYLLQSQVTLRVRFSMILRLRVPEFFKPHFTGAFAPALGFLLSFRFVTSPVFPYYSTF